MRIIGGGALVSVALMMMERGTPAIIVNIPEISPPTFEQRFQQLIDVVVDVPVYALPFSVSTCTEAVEPPVYKLPLRPIGLVQPRWRLGHPPDD